MVVTAPDAASEVVRQCAAAGVKQVWFHRAIDQGSLSKEAVAMCREQGITPIVGGCPMMYVAPVDVGHRCMRAVLGWTHKLPTA